MAPSKPYAEIRAHKHNSPVFVAQALDEKTDLLKFACGANMKQI